MSVSKTVTLELVVVARYQVDLDEYADPDEDDWGPIGENEALIMEQESLLDGFTTPEDILAYADSVNATVRIYKP